MQPESPPREATEPQGTKGCLSSFVRLIAAPCSLGALLTIGSPLTKNMTLSQIALVLFIGLFLVGLLDGWLRRSPPAGEEPDGVFALLAYAFVFSSIQCVIATVIGIAILFLACANSGYL